MVKIRVHHGGNRSGTQSLAAVSSTAPARRRVTAARGRSPPFSTPSVVTVPSSRLHPEHPPGRSVPLSNVMPVGTRGFTPFRGCFPHPVPRSRHGAGRSHPTPWSGALPGPPDRAVVRPGPRPPGRGGPSGAGPPTRRGPPTGAPRRVRPPSGPALPPVRRTRATDARRSPGPPVTPESAVPGVPVPLCARGHSPQKARVPSERAPPGLPNPREKTAPPGLVPSLSHLADLPELGV